MITFFVINGILIGVAVALTVAEKYLVSYGKCSVTINKDKTFDVDGGDSLLNYLTEKRLFIPSACGGKATCGFCKVQVISGAGDILPTEEAFITKAEAENGTRLACQVKVKGEVDIRIPEYMLGAEEFRSTATGVIDVTHDIKHVILAIEDGKRISFKPGQYVQIKIPGTDEYRAYSVASPPYITDKVELTIRVVPGGLCSNYVHTALYEGDSVTFTGPFGDFYLREESAADVICIGGGCGMAPVRSIVHHLAKKGMPRRCLYFFGARTTKDLFFTEEFRALEAKFPNFKYIPALSEPKPDERWDGEVGLITQIVDKYVDAGRKMEAYLCGPPPMIDAAMALLPKKGIAPGDIYFDKF